MNFRVTAREAGGVALMEASGRLTMGRPAECLREAVGELMDTGYVGLVLNLTRVSRLDSVGVGEIVAAQTAAARRGGLIVLVRPSEQAIELLHLTKLATVLDIYTHEIAALNAVRARMAGAA